jgi:uncharacterized protein (DUF488 family)
MLDEYRKGKGPWSDYEKQFLELIASREIEHKVERSLLADSCLLCSEDLPDKCHRRLVAEYLSNKWGQLQVQHL